MQVVPAVHAEAPWGAAKQGDFSGAHLPPVCSHQRSHPRLSPTPPHRCVHSRPPNTHPLTLAPSNLSHQSFTARSYSPLPTREIGDTPPQARSSRARGDFLDIGDRERRSSGPFLDLQRCRGALAKGGRMDSLEEIAMKDPWVIVEVGEGARNRRFFLRAEGFLLKSRQWAVLKEDARRVDDPQGPMDPGYQ
ncbi:hypothetical protein KM043_014668 [Ampulex compressa]|nr:hypothetical protein KM043_014668 [Ampulex compressa]